MAKKKSPEGAPLAILVSYEKPDSLGTHSVSFAPVERVRDEQGNERPRTPDAARGWHLGNGELCWAAFRHNRTERGRMPPIPLDLSHAGPTYRRAHFVDADDAAAMVATFKKIDKAMAAQRQTYGWTTDFAEQALRIAAAFEAGSFAVERGLYIEVMRPGKTWHEMTEGHRWVWVDTRDARDFLTALRDVDLPKPAAEEHAS